MQHRTTIVAILVGLTLASATSAQVSPTVCNPGNSALAAAKFDVVISTSNVNLSGVTSSEYVAAVRLAIDRWNEQSNQVYFVYSGLVNSSYDHCSAGRSVISVIEGSNGEVAAQHRRACSDTQFEIDVHRSFGFIEEGNPDNWSFIPWDAGDTASNRVDLTSVLIHELGHAAGLDHPTQVDGAPPAIMAATGQSERFRDFFEADFVCADFFSTRRSVNAVRRYVSNGSVGSEYSFFPQVAKAAAGTTKNGGYWRWSSALLLSDDEPRWTEDFSSANTEKVTVQGGDIGWLSPGLTETTWRERDEGMDRILFISPFDDTDGNRKVFYSRSDDGFTNSDVTYEIEVCESMDASSTGTNPVCATSRPVFSAGPISVAWHDGNQKTVIAYTEMARDTAEDRTVRVAIGSACNWQFANSTSLGVKSSVEPSVACSNNGAYGGRDCVVAYVDDSDPQNYIRTVMFSIFYNGGARSHYAGDVKVSTSPIGISRKTGARLASFYQGGYFYVVYKTQEPGQKVKVLRDIDGYGEYTFVQTLDFSASGPTVVGHFDGAATNAIVTMEN